MKSRFITFLAVLAFGSVGIVSLAQAEDYEIGAANIPFDFYVGKQKMPAGSYSIGLDLDTYVISFTERSSKRKTFVSARPKTGGNGLSVLEFNHLGTAYALEKVESDDYDWVFQTKMHGPPTESTASSHVEVALSR
jgi:hypothetical protein